MKANLLIALGLLIALSAEAQVRSQRSQANASSQRSHQASPARTVQPQTGVAGRGGPGVGMRFNRPHVEMPERVTIGGSPHTRGGSIGSAIRLNGTPGGAGFNAGQQLGINPTFGNSGGGASGSAGGGGGVIAGAGGGGGVGVGGAGGGGGVGIAPGASHTDMVIQMHPGENLYIFPKTATVAAQRLRAQHEAAMRAARANAASRFAPESTAVDSVQLESDSDLASEFPPLPQMHARTERAIPVVPPTQSETEEAETDDSGETERSTVVPISVASGPLFDNDTLLEWQQQNALKGNPQSQYAMGLRYLTGTGVERDDQRAREWLEKASAQGELRARSKLRELNRKENSARG